MSGVEKWLTMGLLCLSGSVIFWLPLFSDIFYIPMQNAFGFTKTQMGLLLSTFGAVSLIAYFPGGWLADRFFTTKTNNYCPCDYRPGRFCFLHFTFF